MKTTFSAVIAVLCGLTFSPALVAGEGGSRHSQAGSGLFHAGSQTVAAGSVEILHGGAQLIVTGAERTAAGLSFVLEPVGRAASTAAQGSQAVTIEISLAAWDRVSSALHASGHAAVASALLVGHAIEAVALTASVVDLTASEYGSALGLALVAGDVVVAILPDDRLRLMLTHGIHP